MCAGAGVPSTHGEWRQSVNMGVLQVAHGCVEKTADEHGFVHGVEQSTIEADGAAIIGLMHGQSTNGSSRDMMQQTTGFEHNSRRGPRRGNAYCKSCGVSAGVAALVEVVGGRGGGEIERRPCEVEPCWRLCKAAREDVAAEVL
jgi:hypothetical protein